MKQGTFCENSSASQQIPGILCSPVVYHFQKPETGINSESDETRLHSSISLKQVKEKGKIVPVQAVEALGLREAGSPTFSDIRLTDGGKVVSPTRRPLLPPGRFLVLIFVRS
jgi:hypothetical protein